MNPTIRIFACDHRHGVKWNLPYIRFGGVESECAIRCPNQIGPYFVNADETPKLYWLWKHLDDFGTDYIGYCQYRRFFANIGVPAVNTQVKYSPLINITAAKFNYMPEVALRPEDQLNLMTQGGANHLCHFDGILHPAFKVVDEYKTPYKYIWEQIEILSKDDMLPHGWHKHVFDLLLANTPDKLKPAMENAFEAKPNYLCNIFTCKTKLFKQFGEITFPTVLQILAAMKEKNINQNKLHLYWLAYIFERFTSCYFHALESMNHRFAKIPLVCIDANKHIAWTKPENK